MKPIKKFEQKDFELQCECDAFGDGEYFCNTYMSGFVCLKRDICRNFQVDYCIKKVSVDTRIPGAGLDPIPRNTPAKFYCDYCGHEIDISKGGYHIKMGHEYGPSPTKCGVICDPCYKRTCGY